MAKILIIALIIALIVVARRSQPASNKAGVSLLSQPQQTEPPEVLKVASYNIQTGKGLDGKRNLLASARVIADADVVGVQEVYAAGFDGFLGLSSGQTERLAKVGNFGWLFSATRQRWFREHRGNAILSKVPVSDWRVEMLPDESGKSFRNMTVAQIHWQGRSFHFINTHLHTRGGREDQLKRVLQEFAKYPRAIILGDFNSRANTPSLASTLKDIEITDAISTAGLDLENTDRIDWILTKGFTVEAGKMLEKGVSDHPYYQVSLSYR
ncbi:MAG: endonuclease/exonuclease/phosphatase family protein [Arenicella sp.]|nr:endonuclease/exonuclease/phosphatase family protein [Arenicella sp.]